MRTIGFAASLSALCLAVGSSCGVAPSSPSPQNPHSNGAAASANSAGSESSEGWNSYGAPLAIGPQGVSLDALASDPGGYDGKNLIVRDMKVESVCKKKGCWMVVRNAATPIRVTFKDYGFFVPTDCEGRSVVLEGTFAVKTVPEGEARHYLEDAGRHEDAMKIVGDQKELTIVASGVRLSK